MNHQTDSNDTQSNSQTGSEENYAIDSESQTQSGVPLVYSEDSLGDEYQPVNYFITHHQIPSQKFVSEEQFPDKVESLLEPMTAVTEYVQDNDLYHIEIGEYDGYVTYSISPSRIRVGNDEAELNCGRQPDTDTAVFTKMQNTVTGDRLVKIPAHAAPILSDIGEQLAGRENTSQDVHSIWISSEDLADAFSMLRKNQLAVIIPWGVQIRLVGDTFELVSASVERIQASR